MSPLNPPKYLPRREFPYDYVRVTAPRDKNVLLRVKLQTQDGLMMADQWLPDQPLCIQVPDSDLLVLASTDQIASAGLNGIDVVRMTLVRMLRPRQLEVGKATRFPIC